MVPKPKSNLSKHQAFTAETVNRQQLRAAPYNPRYMSDDARKRLRASLKKNGLVEALVWNRQTGNLVGGHQRLSELDALEGHADYDLTVCVVNVDEAKEKGLNIALNNRSIQGEYDADALADMLRGLDESAVQTTAFNDADLELLLGSVANVWPAHVETQERTDAKDKLAEMHKARAEMKQHLEEGDSAQFYAVIVFEDQAARTQFYQTIGRPVADIYLQAGDVTRHLPAYDRHPVPGAS